MGPPGTLRLFLATKLLVLPGNIYHASPEDLFVFPTFALDKRYDLLGEQFEWKAHCGNTRAEAVGTRAAGVSVVRDQLQNYHQINLYV